MNKINGFDKSMSPETNPWKGLFFYTEQDRDIFFGRDKETGEFVQILQRGILSVLFARSGLGKTSLLRAGVMPQLRERNYLPVIVRIDYSSTANLPSRQILRAVIEAAKKSDIEIESADPSIQTISIENSNYTLWEIFHEFQFWGPRNDLISPVLILDQFEEVFTLGQQNAHAEVFLDQLADLSENRMPQEVRDRIEKTGERPVFDTRSENYRVVLSLREDFVPKLDLLRPMIPSVMRNRFALTPLDQEQGIEIVLRAGDEWVSASVAREIVTAVAGGNGEHLQQSVGDMAQNGIEPAYLSVMCHELFHRMTELGRREIGSDLVALEQGNILDGLYERSFEGMTPDVRVFVEDRLLTATGFRGSVPLAEAELSGISSSQLKTLVDRRLIRFEDRLGTTHVELSHDLLTQIVAESRNRRTAEAERKLFRKREAEIKAKLRRSRIQIYSISAAIFLLLGGIAFYYFGWAHTYYTYCTVFSKKLGVAYPVNRISSRAIKHRSWTYRVTKKGWFVKNNIVRFEVINANNQLTGQHNISTYLSTGNTTETHLEKECRYEYVYDDKGRVVYEVAWNRLNQMVWGLVYSPYLDDGDQKNKTVQATFLGPDGYPKPQGSSRAEFIEITYDKRGFEVKHHYRDREGNLMPGRDNAYGKIVEYDKKGRIIRETSIDGNDNPINDEYGNSILIVKYDSKGNIKESIAQDKKSEPTLCKWGFYRQTFTFDKWNRLTSQKFWGLSGEPVIVEDWQAHYVKYEYDNFGNLTKRKVFGINDEMIVTDCKYFAVKAHEERMEYDKQNRLRRISYLDESENYLTGVWEWNNYIYEYDENSFIKSLGYFNSEAPVLEKTTGAHKFEWITNKLGQKSSERVFDTTHNPVMRNDGGYHLIKYEYDDSGNEIAASYFDSNDKAVVNQDIGAHRCEKMFNTFRKPLIINYFDEYGKPHNNKFGFYQEKLTYDVFGSVLSKCWINKDNHPCNGPSGVHAEIYKYDNKGQRLSIHCLGVDNKPTVNNLGIFETIYEYNDKCQQTKKQLFGINEEPAEDEWGNHLIIKEFDERGRPIKLSRLRADGAPNYDRDLGIATVTRIYDKNNHWVEQAYYDNFDKLVIGTWGFAKGAYEEEPDGRVAQVNYGTNGKPLFNHLLGFAIKKTDSRNQGTTVNSYYGSDGELINGPEGYAEVRTEWDGNGNRLSVSYWGADGAPAFGLEGYHKKEFGSSNTSEVNRYFDTENNEMSSLGPDHIVSVIFIKAIINIKKPSFKAGLQAGDIIWCYGNWSFPKAIEIEGQFTSDTNKYVFNAADSLIREIKRISSKSATITVIRNGQVVSMTMPVLPEKKIGVELSDRSVPIKIYDKWKKMGQ